MTDAKLAEKPLTERCEMLLGLRPYPKREPKVEEKPNRPGFNCPNEKCGCPHCTCGSGCTCGISKEVNCDPCANSSKNEWPELVGQSGEEAVAKIQAERPDLK